MTFVTDVSASIQRGYTQVSATVSDTVTVPYTYDKYEVANNNTMHIWVQAHTTNDRYSTGTSGGGGWNWRDYVSISEQRGYSEYSLQGTT